MALQRIKIGNKLLSMCNNESKFYIGDFMGNVIKLDANSFKKIDILYGIVDHPISAIKSCSNEEIIDKKETKMSSLVIENMSSSNHKKIEEKEYISCKKFNIFIGTWRGSLFKLTFSEKDNKLIKIIEKKLENNSMVKSIEFFCNFLFISCGICVYQVNPENLEIVNFYDTKYKVLSMEIFKNELYLGLNTGKILKFTNPGSNEKMEIIDLDEFHQSSVLGMSIMDDRLITCSADKSVKIFDENIPIYKSEKDWIRCIDKNIIGCGNSVLSIVDNNFSNFDKLYEHDDVVSAVGIHKNTIVSIGLDGVICITKNNIEINSDEERELEALMK